MKIMLWLFLIPLTYCRLNTEGILGQLNSSPAVFEINLPFLTNNMATLLSSHATYLRVCSLRGCVSDGSLQFFQEVLLSSETTALNCPYHKPLGMFSLFSLPGLSCDSHAYPVWRPQNSVDGATAGFTSCLEKITQVLTRIERQYYQSQSDSHLVLNPYHMLERLQVFLQINYIIYLILIENK